MSFFNDFINSIAVDDIQNKILANVVFGVGIKLSGNFKLEQMEENEIVLKLKKEKFKVIGSGLEIATVAKGEIEIIGNVCGVIKYDWYN